ncbi:MAG: CDP-glycerol glycerophosphotransferase family protein [Marinifilaceae bacterium]
MAKQIKLFGKVTVQQRDSRGYIALVKRIFMLKLGQLLYKFYVKKPEYKNLWLISERGDDARDNGYHFYKYVITNHPEINVRYVISRESNDSSKIASLGVPAIPTNSFKHYIALFCASNIISTHCGRGLYVGLKRQLKRMGVVLKGKHVFLQHGVIKDDMPELYYPKMDLDIFISGAKPEYDYLVKQYRYPPGVINLTGLARFDNLHNVHTKPQILLMPTWRTWLQFDNEESFQQSEYYKYYTSLLRNEWLNTMLQNEGIKLIFYPHYELQRFIHLFDKCKSNNIIIASKEEYDVQELLKQSMLLITDYSSVYFDFAYMRKPVIYYQFDHEVFFKNHYLKGYFDVKRDGFGPLCFYEQSVVDEIEKILSNNLKVSDSYLKRMEDFFSLYDTKNCERIYNAIVNL